MKRILPLIVAVVAMLAPLAGQDSSSLKPQAGIITGTVTDTNGDILSGATVVLHGRGQTDAQQVVSDDNGSFQFRQLDPGTYQVTISASGFADWNSPESNLSAGQYLILSECQLHIAAAVTTVHVTDNPVEVATEQVRTAEKQRVFGVIPNFYVVYEPDPVPLTTKLKFQLAMKTSTDVVTIAGVGAFAAINQAGDTPNYPQGVKGYGERLGAAAADGFADIMIGGAILPAVLHQDPRYYYRGTGSNRSRVLHAVSSPFVCRGDNGRLQPNFSSVGGDLGSSALSNLYYPPSNRGTGLVFQNFAVTTGERMFSDLVQEFLLSRVTFRPKDKN